jgi:hypothetical protein
MRPDNALNLRVSPINSSRRHDRQRVPADAELESFGGEAAAALDRVARGGLRHAVPPSAGGRILGLSRQRTRTQKYHHAAEILRDHMLTRETRKPLVSGVFRTFEIL